MINTVPMVSILEHSLCMQHYHVEIPAADACKIYQSNKVLRADANVSQLSLSHCPWVALRVIEAGARQS
ncbi:unnamed protein product [Clonostachys byssicola]|uniref:Uncharacterized protein n=1 Tax=Clonostachys byssicola TaxID=160290 RepID=A0A9N9UMK0_9HYPO|nr:unnamed protein product [Clonostachys byssicola]